ncbi:MAG: protoporphyrinogen oxidase [Cyclobacteriaceae bacterium]
MIAIIGGGISGLTTAFYLQEQGIDYILFEAKKEAGGCIKSISFEEKNLSVGPNTLLCDEHVTDLIQKLDLEDKVKVTSPASKDRFILKNGKVRKLPSNPIQLLFSSFFSFKTKRSILKEFKAKDQEVPNETVYDFFLRRFGKEICDYTVNPFVSGIYAGDPKKLIVSKAFPTLTTYEKSYGSVLKGFIKNKAKARKETISFEGGISTLVDTLVNKLESYQPNASISQIEKKETGFTLHADKRRYEVDQVILSFPASEASKLLKLLYPRESKLLAKAHYPSMVVTHTFVEKKGIKSVPTGFGVLHPKIENKFSSGTIWYSSIFPTENDDYFHFVSFTGGTQYSKESQLPKAKIEEKVMEELRETYSIYPNTAFKQSSYKWTQSIPQYDKNIVPISDIVNKLKNDHIHVCSNWHDGISVPSCIKKGKELALLLRH